MQSLAQRLENGGVLSSDGVSAAAQPFLAALFKQLFPHRPLVVVNEGLKSQESFQQDVSTWLQVANFCSRIGEGYSGVRPSSGAAGSNNSDDVGNRAPSHTSDVAAPEDGRTPLNNYEKGPLLFYPAWEILPHEERLPHVDVISERLETLVALAQHNSQGSKRAPLVVTSVTALLERTFPVQLLGSCMRTLNRGERIEPLDLVEWLEDQGYEPEAQVTQKGEISLRGGILDVYPLTSPWPVRMEFFGDELESLRHFDPLTQVSREPIETVTIPPAGELGLLKREQSTRAAGFRPGSSLQNQELGSNVDTECKGKSGSSRMFHQSELGTLLDYLPSETIFLLLEPEPLGERADEYARQVPKNDAFFISWEELREQAVARGMTILSLAAAEPLSEQAEMDLASAESAQTPSREGSAGLHNLRFDSLEAFRPLGERPPEPQVAESQRREFFNQLHRWLRQNYAVHVFCNNDGERQRFIEIWQEYGLQSSESTGQSPQSEVQGPKSKVRSLKSGTSNTEHSTLDHRLSTVDYRLSTDLGLWIHIGTLSRGFLCAQASLVVVTDAEIFGRYKVQRPRRLKSPHAQATRSALDIDFADLDEGDYVVHLQHGIGLYLGLQVLPLGAGTKPAEKASTAASAGQECLVIEYAPNDSTNLSPKLYVPVTEAHLVSKYVGTGKVRPPLNTLGGTRWAKAKAQAESAVRDVAGELLSIQAARESQAGHPFKPDTSWQREFEGAFLFEETPDQMRAIVEAKADMERPKPMDRLICGDVGFGKTEVGIRAAFKAVMDGKQVAILVPTTVLAQQHYNTFRERMADYPVRIELLSRFRTRRAQERVVKDLAAGSVDIVIGTHRLLQNDIAFKDLGLVVIDEEQRFGVLHKEKFKMLRKLVDVLTLSATPIPRTLYLALTGARDMSTIQTPPHDRLPVETIVIQYDERTIRDAIQRELNRGGQVFFLHNRVLTIQTMAQKLAMLVPQARIVVGHGQMHSDELEEVMTRFVNGEADVLLSTTIIESGLDIPNANTILIDRADRFGLSDLYQLRGRVGRYKHQAYAYLLLPRHAGLLADVRKRLSAIKQYSTLGSGFKIAMRDLEIRGAGNLLGAEQSGHITAVGFDLYCQLLKQSVASLKGEKVKPRIEVNVRLDFLALSPVEEGPPSTVQSAQSAVHAAYIPFNYISDARLRIEIYRKVAQASDASSLQALNKELRDRFGPIPVAMELLLKVAELKILASERRITVIEVKEDKIMLTRDNDYMMIAGKFPRLKRKDPAARLKEIKKLILALQIQE